MSAGRQVCACLLLICTVLIGKITDCLNTAKLFTFCGIYVLLLFAKIIKWLIYCTKCIYFFLYFSQSCSFFSIFYLLQIYLCF